MHRILIIYILLSPFICFSQTGIIYNPDGKSFIINPVVTETPTNPALSYTLSVASTVSAGVFKPDSTLVRTLFNNEQQSAGIHAAPYWDGKDDDGNSVADGNYQIRILSNNLQYQWEGIIGNSSKYTSGSRVHHPAAEGFWDMRIIGKKAVYCVEYNEGQAAEFSFNTDSAQVKIPIWNSPEWPSGKTGIVTSKMCTDGTNLYFSGIYKGATKSAVFAKKVSDYSDVIFANGTVVQTQNGPENFIAYPSCIDLYTTTNDSIYRVSGLAVQKTGNYLFVARQLLNSVHVLNKNTGALVQTLSFDKPGYMDADPTATYG